MMVSFIDVHRVKHGVEPICAQLPIAPSTYYAHKARAGDPERLPARSKRDEALMGEIQRVWEEHFRQEGLAAAGARGDYRGPLHRGAAHGRSGPARRRAR